jgi:RNA polymerase-binding transcription factor DksA
MPINPNISLAVKGIELQDPLAQYGKIAAIQGAQQQNQLAQLQMQNFQREQESTNALNRAYAEAYNPQTGEVDVNKLRGSLSTGGFGSKLPGIEKGLLELGEAKTKQQKAQSDLDLIKSAYMNDLNNGTDDTSPTFKAFEEGSETMSKEANSQLAIRQEKFIRDLKNALFRVENKTYGVCKVTGKLISKERLLIVPHATMSIEAKNLQR